MLSKSYSKIETLLDRDPETFMVIEGKYRRPEFGIIDPWIVTEKIDGTNIRLHFYYEEKPALDDIIVEYEIGGRTENAQIQTNLFGPLKDICEKIRGGVGNILSAYGLQSLTIYGEGYGAGVQNGGKYRKDRGFAVFDMSIDDVAYLSYDQTAQNCFELGLEHVPEIGTMRRQEIVNLVSSNSLVSRYGNFPAEGVVARPLVELRNVRGRRVMFKLKRSDYEQHGQSGYSRKKF